MLHLDRISNYLCTKKKSKFSGSIKLGFEGGKVVSIGESNAFDAPTSRIVSTDDEKTCISRACCNDYNGSVVFVFKYGEIIEYGYIRTYKGDDLRSLFEG